MYKFLLCLRYLRTRYIALACIISVTLGVATMIVVNSVMSGFGHEMEERMQSMISDLVLESRGHAGFPGAEWHMDAIREVLGDDVVGMTPTVHVPALLDMQVGEQTITREIVLIGIDPKTSPSVSKLSEYMIHPENRDRLSFELREDGFGDRLPRSGWSHRRQRARRNKELAAIYGQQPAADAPEGAAAADEAAPAAAEVADVEAGPVDAGPVDAGWDAPPPADVAAGPLDDWGQEPQPEVFDPERQQNPGVVLGIALSSFRTPDGDERFLNVPGDDVKIAFWLTGMSQRTAVSSDFTIVDFSESKMSEYDARFVFVDIHELQRMRGMIDPTTGVANVSAIQMKLREGVDPNEARQKLQAYFPPQRYAASTWRDKQLPLLEAINMEMIILNILLFMIIAVAGFGILAIFSMIVVEKTKDIGVLKSLGASSGGVMSIFLGYGLSLGLVGSGGGMILGLLFVDNIDLVRRAVEYISGREVFDPTIYYFQEIPTLVEPLTVTWIVCGAMSIAVIASILPAMRAARLQPVEALRYE
ncbi:MAG: ABC transporter permease [Planctomycetota bacterium]|nr:MAG: ABC transporter permease [Planctomycetota bacterium]REJ97607.1 MAG: ABC transporter permease [Planctomycetota bacterium]REK23029.1 MAG: ABC transporter permease [Planctomycetota bacterium]REK43392.1 MAG: ABC transporter permease [Planctomycetota bacterium]